MASAWEQLGEIERVNQLRRQAQLGRAVNGVYPRTAFSSVFPEETLLKVVAPAQSRLVVATTADDRTGAAVAHAGAICASRPAPSPRRCGG